MTCHDIEHQEIVERYLAGALPPEEARAFEEHYFACASCLARLEAAQSLTAAWPAPEQSPQLSQRRWVLPLAIAASLFIATTSLVFWRSSKPPEPPLAQRPELPSAIQAPAEYAALGRFEPPPYREIALRGSEGKGGETFRQAMRFYQANRFSDALPLLRVAASQPSAGADVLYFAGVTSVLAGEPADGLDFLRRADALGFTAYQEEIRYYSALTLLQLGDVAAARKQLNNLAAMKGDWKPKARELLRKLP